MAYKEISEYPFLLIREDFMVTKKIVITGGPCGGKSTGLEWIKKAFTDMGYTVLFIPETATELISGGVCPWTTGSNVDFQKCVMRLQLEKEKTFEAAAETMSAEKVLIVCDRGAVDNKAYMTQEEFSQVLSFSDIDEVTLRDSYDAVFHLVTAAKGAEKFYTTSNNTARTETVEQASALDDRLVSVWTGHPHLRIIDNSTDFEGKMKRLIMEISAFLGEPEPFETERKFLIEYPDINALRENPYCEKIDICQTYILEDGKEECRVRKRGAEGSYIYFKTAKTRVSDIKRIETEERITRKEYEELLKKADPTRNEIRKTRYCLVSGNMYFEIDVYPFWTDKAIMEIELTDEAQPFSVPENIKIIKEVTEDEAYKNSSLAKK